MALITIVRSFDHLLQLGHIVWIGKVDDVDVDIISLQTLSKFFAHVFVFFNWVANENDDSLPLVLVLAMF